MDRERLVMLWLKRNKQKPKRFYLHVYLSLMKLFSFLYHLSIRDSNRSAVSQSRWLKSREWNWSTSWITQQLLQNYIVHLKALADKRRLQWHSMIPYSMGFASKWFIWIPQRINYQKSWSTHSPWRALSL